MQTTREGVPVRRLEIAAYAGMFVFGIVMALLGAILPVIAGRLHVDLARAGSLFGAMGGAMLVSGFASGPFMDRYGKKSPMVFGPLLTALAVCLMAGAASYTSLMTAVLALGFGGGVINSVTNAVVADLHDDPRRKSSALMLLGVFFGIGALALPFAIGRLLAALGLERILLASAALAGVAAVLAAVPRYPRPAHDRGFSGREAAKLVRHPVVLALGASLFLQSGNEFVLSGFLATFLTSALGATVRTASYLLALYWTTVLAARLGFSRLLLRAPGPLVLVAGGIGSAVGVIWIALSGSLAGAAVGIVVLGACISSIFPTTLGVASSRFATYSGTVFGILFGMSLTGGLLVPPVFGVLAGSAGIRLALALPAGAFCGIAAIHGFYTARLSGDRG